MSYTPKQTIQQTNFPMLVPFWRALDPATKLLWKNLGVTPPETDTNSLGLVYKLSGWQWYCRVNTRLNLISQARLDSPPIGGPVAPPTGVTLEADSSPSLSLIAYFDSLPFVVAPYGVFFLKFVPGSGTSVAHSGFYAVITQDVTGLTQLDLTFRAQALFGPWNPGDTFWLRLQCQSAEALRSIKVSAAAVST